MTIIETARLRVRELQTDDLDDLFRLMSDPEIMRYIRAADTDREVVRERMGKWAAYHAEHPKLGVFALETLNDPSFAGYCVARHAN
ncbi:MAG: GNAT family N-acetyltransferase, partial [Saprospiraceae bacterium]